MTENILSYPGLVDDLVHESDVLKTGLELLESTLDEAADSEAQQRLYFIVGALSESQKRFQGLAEHANALRRLGHEARTESPRNQEGVAA